ncbi:MAG: response regulator transcription factor [Anaerolineae bacterium]|nr:response regulator transcription factor [Anaerolineae bacterium]MBL6966188.1 response regulator transcription factor [Anaerolineales bacterium]
MPRIRVLLVDDHEIVRLGLMMLINDQPNMEVVGEAGNAADAIICVGRTRPNVVLMDIRLPGASGIEAMVEITGKFPEIKVVILTSYTGDQLVIDAIQAGAAGYVLKQVGNEELLRAITAAAQGEALLDTSITARLIAHVRKVEKESKKSAFTMLSDRELDVLLEISQGKTNAEIGQMLNLQEKTVRNYVSNILSKLELSNRIELAIYAVENRLFEYRDRS